MNKRHFKNGEFAPRINWKKRILSLTILAIAGIWVYGIVSYVRLYDELTIPTIAEAQVNPELSIYDQICQASKGENCDVLYNLAKCESTLNPDAVHVNSNGSVDMGLMQINSVHKDISNADKFDLTKSVQWTNERIKKGDGSIWTCWKGL